MNSKIRPLLIWGVLLWILSKYLKRPVKRRSNKRTEKRKEYSLFKAYSKTPYIAPQPYSKLKKKKATAKKMRNSMAYSAAIRSFNKQFKK